MQRIQNSHCVGDPQTANPGGLGGLCKLDQKIPVSTRRILRADGKKLKGVAEFGRQLNQSAQNPGSVFFPGAQMNFRNRQRKMRAVNTATCSGLQVFTRAATPRRQPHAVDTVADGIDVINFRLAHRRNAEFKFQHAGTGKRGGNADFFRARERHARRLLAVAQRGVNEMNAGRVHANKVAGGSAAFSSRLSRIASAVSMVACLYQMFSG